MKRLLLLATTCVLTLAVRGQTSTEETALTMLRADTLARTRLVTRSTLYGLGYTNVYDTYLSPQEYTGIEGRVAHESLRRVSWFQKRKAAEVPTSRLWVRQSWFEGNVGYTHNRADNNNTLSALVHWTYALMHPWQPAPGLRLLAGPALDIDGGFVYNMRNGNNPAQARAYLNLGATGMAVYDTRILRRRVSLRYQLTVPLVGLMFSPHYGQSYYEIFSLGNTGGIVNFTSLHNQPALRQTLMADIPFRRMKLRVAYVCDIQQSRLHQIETHTYSHVFMLGFVRELYLFPPKR